ncbi:MAG: hypothetical protein IJB98_02255 [Clostridia bacterium]|nr:hypothetical protein [Clostridia bacterium]
MTETQTRVQTARQTEQDFFAGYKPLTPTTDRIASPVFKPYTFDTEPEVSTSYYQAPTYTETPSYTETPAFEVEKGYSFDTSTYETSKAMATPSIERREEIVARDEQVQTKTYAKAKLNARGKIIVAVYSIVVAIIVALCIYNAVAISGMTSDIAYKEAIVASQTEIISSLESTYNSLGEEDVIISSTAGEFKTPTESDIVRIDGFEMAERTSTKTQTNWFEDLCEAIRKLFS